MGYLRFDCTSQVEQQFIEDEVCCMLQLGLIRPLQSPWASQVVLVMKKNGKMRYCVDYRELNCVTCKDAYHLPCVDNNFDSLSKAR